MIRSRTSLRPFGIVAPVSALPGPFGVGDMGPEAVRFLHWLHRCGATSWQVLPLTIPDSVGSPYASPSNLAGNWQLISPEFLRRDGWLLAADLPRPKKADARVDHQAVGRSKLHLLRLAYQRFQARATETDRRALRTWQRKQGEWLDRFVLYQAIKDEYRGRPWWEWHHADRDFAKASRHVSESRQVRKGFHAFCQWMFYTQWMAVKYEANRLGISIIGDLPFYMPLDSAVVWAEPDLFELDSRGRPTVVAGVPPDSFSRLGQRWGNPVYRWSVHRQQHWRWWVERFVAARQLYDEIRFDHFRGLVATWHVPVRAHDARRGHWVATPGRALLGAVRRRLGRLPIIAEDLGYITPEVNDLRETFQIPGVRVMQYAWSGLPRNPHAISAIGRDVVYYTATHDTNTTKGWWQDEAKQYERTHVREALGGKSLDPWKAMSLAASTKARIVMVPIQDVFGLGTSARLNTPGTKRRNWAWRFSSNQLTAARAQTLRRIMTPSRRA